MSVNRNLADALAGQLINLDFLSRTSGIVDTTIEHVKGGNVTNGKRVPTSRKVYLYDGDDLIDEPDIKLKRMIPGPNEKGVLFFKDKGSKRIDGGSTTGWEGQINLVCWLNTEHNNGVDSEAALTVLKETLPDEFEGGQLEIRDLKPRRPHPFIEYDLDEKESQFLTWPRDYFEVELYYVYFGSKNCANTQIFIDLGLADPPTAGADLAIYSIAEADTGLKDYDGSAIYVRGYNLVPGGYTTFNNFRGYVSDLLPSVVKRVVDWKITYELNQMGWTDSVNVLTSYHGNIGMLHSNGNTGGAAVNEYHIPTQQPVTGLWFIWYTKN